MKKNVQVSLGKEKRRRMEEQNMSIIQYDVHIKCV